MDFDINNYSTEFLYIYQELLACGSLLCCLLCSTTGLTTYFATCRCTVAEAAILSRVEINCVIFGDGVIKLYVFSILAFVMAKGSNNPRGKTSDASKPYDVSNVSKTTMNSRAKVNAHGGRWSAMVDL